MFTVLASLALVAACDPDAGADDDALADAALLDAALLDAAPLPDAGPAPLLRQAVTLPDAELAAKATALLGIGTAGAHSCNDCHAPTRALLDRWHDLGDTATRQCLQDLQVSTPESARKTLDCFRIDPADAASPFMTAKVGWYAAAAHLDWFKYTFARAYGEDGAAKLEAFRQRVGMPKGAHQPFTQAEFDVVAEWFVRGMPDLDARLP